MLYQTTHLKVVQLLLLALLAPLSLRAQSATSLRIRGNLVGSTKPYYFIRGIVSRRTDTLRVKPDGSFDKILTNWPGLEEVAISGQNLYTHQWFAPGFDLVYSLSVSPKLEPLERSKQSTVSGVGSVLNQYEWDEAAINEYGALREKKLPAAEVKQRVVRIRGRMDSLWQARFPAKVARKLARTLPVFAEYARIKRNERLFTYFRYWLQNSSDTAAINREFMTLQTYQRLCDPENAKCYNCLLVADYYVDSKLAKSKSSMGSNAFYALKLPEYKRLFPKAVADAIIQDILLEIVTGYEYEASPTPAEIMALIDQYYPADKEDDKGKLLNRLSQLQIRKKALHESFGINAKAPSFQAVDSTGRVYTLDSFRGKVVYIDFWASWCGPCRAEMPYVREFREKYKNNPGIVFINLAVHDKEGNWKRAVREEKPTGLTLWDKLGEASKAYKANFIPRYVLIGKNGELLDAYNEGPRLADGATQAAIEKALK